MEFMLVITCKPPNIKPDVIINAYFDDIIFNEDIYASYLSSGTLELRARLLAADDDIDYEKRR